MTKVPHDRNTQERDELLTINEVADILKIPVGTLRKWRTEGNGPEGFRLGKYVRFRHSAVNRFISAREAANQ
ncbi:helix-turn-helix transcriptional regulator [Amorphoplanes digitatis]|uniref:helix-turn-helix transcriptional regulator n=1 Tax=Actinoplanes digitatis TaxID=1868 RepID=UPI00161581F2|nr:hypothetical protein GCM10020092_031520 [Actinoplanes digitatis]GID94529.1 hypothetical protein Adi01nite_39410 [Actinoplanes digitatis]